MPIYCVATLARYVLVEAMDETAARAVGMKALRELYAPEGRVAHIQIRTIRPATEDEIELQRWHDEILAREAKS